MNGVDESDVKLDEKNEIQFDYNANKFMNEYVLDKNIVGAPIVTSNIPTNDEYTTELYVSRQNDKNSDSASISVFSFSDRTSGPFNSSSFTINSVDQKVEEPVKVDKVAGETIAEPYTCTVSTTINITSTTKWNDQTNPFKDTDLYLSFFKNLRITPILTTNAKINLMEAQPMWTIMQQKKIAKTKINIKCWTG